MSKPPPVQTAAFGIPERSAPQDLDTATPWQIQRLRILGVPFGDPDELSKLDASRMIRREFDRFKRQQRERFASLSRNPIRSR